MRDVCHIQASLVRFVTHKMLLVLQARQLLVRHTGLALRHLVHRAFVSRRHSHSTLTSFDLHLCIASTSRHHRGVTCEGSISGSLEKLAFRFPNRSVCDPHTAVAVGSETSAFCDRGSGDWYESSSIEGPPGPVHKQNDTI